VVILVVWVALDFRLRLLSNLDADDDFAVLFYAATTRITGMAHDDRHRRRDSQVALVFNSGSRDKSAMAIAAASLDGFPSFGTDRFDEY
jgi:hypothetical protein